MGQVNVPRPEEVRAEEAADVRSTAWKLHRVRAGAYAWQDDEPPPDPQVHGKKIEPWLAALLQAEHVSLLVGSGLTSAIAKLAGADPVGMKTVPFQCDLAEAVDRAAAESANRCGRGEPNLEDQVRAARELIAGLRILAAGEPHEDQNELRQRASPLLDAWEKALDDRLRGLLGDVLRAERAEGLVEVQKQVAELLGIHLDENGERR